jgi:hypothetical protein
MREQRRQMPQAATAEVRLDPAKSAHFSSSVPSNDRLAASTPAAGTIYDCPNPPKGKSLPKVAGNPANVGLDMWKQIQSEYQIIDRGGLTRIHRMKWHPASSARQFRLVDQTLKLDQVAESWRTRRVKEEAGGFASISAAFGPTGQSIQGIRVYM